MGLIVNGWRYIGDETVQGALGADLPRRLRALVAQKDQNYGAGERGNIKKFKSCKFIVQSQNCNVKHFLISLLL